MKIVLTIAGSDSCGGAGIQADIKTFAEFGVYAVSVVTAVTSQTPLTISHIYYLPPDSIASQIDVVKGYTNIDAVRIGMLGTAEAVNIVADRVERYDMGHIVVDPVMRSSTGFPLISDDALEPLMTRLIPLSFLVTPNIREAEILSGIDIKGIEDMRESAISIHNKGAENILIKGGHLDNAPVDILYDGRRFYTFEKKRIDREVHGTGCIFSAAITAGLARGNRLDESVRCAKEYTYNIIKKSISSSLSTPTERQSAITTSPIESVSKRYSIIRELEEAIEILKRLRIGRLIPEVQSNMAYAMIGARSSTDVAAIPGRIIKLNDEIYTLKPPAFECSTHISRVVLTAMKYDPDKRSAMNIRYSDEIVSICRRIGLEVAEFNRSQEPQDIRDREGTTVEWGTEYVIREKGRVPDIIYDRGDMGKEPMVRIIANNPLKVVEIIKGIKGEIYP